MRKLLVLFSLAAMVWVLTPSTVAQLDPWWRPLSPYGQSYGVTYGTAAPSIATTGQNPAPGELWVDMDGASDGGAMLLVRNRVSAAWESPGSQVGASIIFEGATADAFETTLTAVDPTADITYNLPNQAAATYALAFSTLATNAVEVANAVWFGTNQLIFESTAVDGFEYIFQPAALTGDVTVTLPSDNADWAGTAAPVYSVLLTNAPDIANSIWGVANGLHYEGATADAFEGSLQMADMGQDTVVYFGDYTEAIQSAIVSTLDNMDIDEANAIWAAANTFIFEGATADAFETTLGTVDAIVDRTINFDGSLGGTVLTARASTEGYSLREGFPNPWRTDFSMDADIVCLTEAWVAATAAPIDTEVNKCSAYNSSFEVWNEQIHTAHAWTPVATGMDIDGDDVDDEGAEFRLFGGDNDLDVGWNIVSQTDVGYLEVRLTITDSSETDDLLIGFVAREAFDDPPLFTTKNTYCSVGVANFADDPRSVLIAEEEDNDGGGLTDTLSDFVDGTAITLRVVIDIAGQCDIWVDGTETNANVMAVVIDAADVLVPFIEFNNCAVGDCGDGTPAVGAIVHYVEVGYLN